MFPSGMATSSTSRSRNGETTPTAAENTISAQTAVEPRAVGPEQRDDPPQVRLPDGRIGRTLGNVVGREGVEASSWHLR